MDKCKSDNECPGICDYCIHYDFGGKQIGHSVGVYVGHGWCCWRQIKIEPHEDCDSFYCENIVYEKKGWQGAIAQVEGSGKG